MKLTNACYVSVTVSVTVKKTPTITRSLESIVTVTLIEDSKVRPATL